MVWGSIFISGTTWRQGGRSRVLRRHEACEIECIDAEVVLAKRWLQQSRRELVRWEETGLVLRSALAQPLSLSPPTLSTSITVTSWGQYTENEVRIFSKSSCLRWKSTMNKGRQRRTLGMQKERRQETQPTHSTRSCLAGKWCSEPASLLWTLRCWVHLLYLGFGPH